MNSIALLGQPNSGKSTIYNNLTGARQHVGNWAGKTVEKNEGSYTYRGTKFTVTDLPGSYGLSGNSDEEIITTDFIKSGASNLTVVLVDASQLERSMFMLAEFAKLDKPALLILNMMDVARDMGKNVDASTLAKKLGIPVLPFNATDTKDYEKLKKLIADELKDPHRLIVPAPAEHDTVKADSQAKFDWVSELLSGVTKSEMTVYKMSKFDRVMTRPILGKVICVGVVLAAFLVAMLIMMPFMGIGQMIPTLLHDPVDKLLTGWNVHPWIVSIFSMMIPNVLYFTISMASFVFGVNIVFGFLEETGFLARAAYQFDGLLSKLGLQGKAICPMLMGFGCTIGGACGTRVMDNWGQRMLAMSIVWAIPCASIWSIIPVISGMFFTWWQTMLVCVGILLYVVITMIVVSKVFSRKLAPVEERSGMIMELPPYHKAHWKHIIKEAFFKAWDIFKRALGTVTLVSVLFYVLSFSKDGNVDNSLLYRVGTFIEPVTRFFGMGWQTFMAFVSGAFAKEAVLSTLNAVFMGNNSLMEATFFAKTVPADTALLGSAMSSAIAPAEALAFMFATTFNIPCLMALSTTYKESHSLKWTFKVALFYICNALVLSCIVYHIANLFM
ncbi:MAG TPA: ferrous iron transporter B [Ruminococcus flavefaciens]|nr:ferrous iron transporter B [Ruminococcus flavefaciens]